MKKKNIHFCLSHIVENIEPWRAIRSNLEESKKKKMNENHKKWL